MAKFNPKTTTEETYVVTFTITDDDNNIIKQETITSNDIWTGHNELNKFAKENGYNFYRQVLVTKNCQTEKHLPIGYWTNRF